MAVPAADAETALEAVERMVTTGAVPDALPLVLGPGFNGPKPLSAVSPGFAGVIIGPRDSGVSEANDVSFGPK